MRRRDLSIQPREITIAAGLLLVALAVRAVDFGNPVIHVDEQYYLLVGDRMLHGAWPYLDIWDRKPIGLFAIFAAIRLLPGDGVLAYQLVATLFAASTAYLIWRGARMLGANRLGACAAGTVYIVWLSLHSGRGGQSPVFYNLFMTGSALLTLRLPRLAGRGARRSIVANGAVACLLAGLAIQTKYTPAVESVFFGVAHMIYLRRAGAGWRAIAGVAALWIFLGLAPTLLVIAAYWLHGAAAIHAFWFANFESILLRGNYSYPPGLIARRLLGIVALESPLIVCAGIAVRRPPRSPEMVLALAWLGAALAGFAVLGTFFDHYALPLIAPIAMIAALTLGRDWRIAVAVLALGVGTVAVRQAMRTSDATGAYALARVVEANSGAGCPYVFTGDSITYHLAHACLPTAYAFPSTLAYAPERGATGIDEAAEVRRILSHRPPVIVRGSRPLAEWNEASRALVDAALARDYRPVFRTPRDDYWLTVYLRNDRPYRSPRPA